MMCNAACKIMTISIIFTILVTFIVYVMLLMHERNMRVPLAEIKAQVDKQEKNDKLVLSEIRRVCQ